MSEKVRFANVTSTIDVPEEIMDELGLFPGDLITEKELNEICRLKVESSNAE